MNIIKKLLSFILMPVKLIFFFNTMFGILIFIDDYEEAQLIIYKMYKSLWEI